MQCIKPYGHLTWNTTCNPGSLPFETGSSSTEKGSEKGDKDDHRYRMVLVKRMIDTVRLFSLEKVEGRRYQKKKSYKVILV